MSFLSVADMCANIGILCSITEFADGSILVEPSKRSAFEQSYAI
jgi:hypothetical protein